MEKYILARAGQGIFVLFVISVLIFIAGRLAGDPAETLLPPMSSLEDIQRIKQSLGLDQPMWVQYGIFVTSALKGDFGTSFHTRRPVMELIAERLPNTAKLGGLAWLLSLTLGLTFGVTAAVKRGTWIDSTLRTVCLIGPVTPGFWMALMMVYIFSVQLDWLPSGRMGGPLHYVLPVLTLGIDTFAGKARLMYAGMVRSLDEDYILLARVKALPERMIIWKHAFRNAVLPVVTIAMFGLAGLVGGTVMIEIVFAWPGIGRLGFEAMMGQDLPLMQAVVLMVSGVAVALNILMDIIYVFIDPRIRYSRAS